MRVSHVPITRFARAISPFTHVLGLCTLYSLIMISSSSSHSLRHDALIGPHSCLWHVSVCILIYFAECETVLGGAAQGAHAVCEKRRDSHHRAPHRNSYRPPEGTARQSVDVAASTVSVSWGVGCGRHASMPRHSPTLATSKGLWSYAMGGGRDSPRRSRSPPAVG